MYFQCNLSCEQEKESIIRVRVEKKNSASLVMPIGDPGVGFVYPTLTHDGFL